MNVTGEGVSSANDLGIWATDANGWLQLIVREGTSLEITPGVFKTVQEIGFNDGSNNEDGLASGFNDLGQIGFAATFTDGTYGVFVSHLVAVPEPTGAAYLTFTILSGLMIRRRETNQRSRD